MSHRSRRRLRALSRPGDTISTPELTSVPLQLSSSFWQTLIVWLFYFLVLTVPFFFTWVNEELFEFNKMLLTYGIAVLIAGSWILRMVYEQRLILKRTWLDLPIAAFVLSQFLSTVFSIHPHTSIFGYYTRFHGGFLSILTYVLLYYAFISNVERRHLPHFFLALFGAALGVTLYAIPEHFGLSPSCVLISGDWNVACWVQDVQNRVFATFGQPNWLAAYAITLIPLGISVSSPLTSEEKKPFWFQLFFAFTTFTLFVTLLFTKSRSGLLGLGVGLGVYLILNLALKMPYTTVLKRWGVTAALLFSFSLATLWFGTPWSPSVTQWLNKLTTTPIATETTSLSSAPVVNRLDVGGTESGEIRKIVWEGALKVWQRYPLFGSGVETFAYSYYQDRPMAHNLVSEWDFLYNKAHNEFLNYLATTGIVGLGAYLVMLWSFLLYPLATIWRRKSTPTPDTANTDQLSLSLVSGLIALSISNALGFSTVMVTILLFLYPALHVVLHDKGQWVNFRISPTHVDTASTVRVVTTIIIGFICLTALTSLMTFWKADQLFAIGKQYDRVGQLIPAVQYFTEAIGLAPNEALYYDELSHTYALTAVAMAEQGEATQAAQVAQAAITNSNKALELNPRHLNFYKTRARVFITLAQLDPSLLQDALNTLETAITLSPTEAKLYYNVGIVQISMEQREQGVATLEKVIEMKPDYEAARYHLAQQYELLSQPEKAVEQYRYILDNINPNNEEVKKAIQLHEVR